LPSSQSSPASRRPCGGRPRLGDFITAGVRLAAADVAPRAGRVVSLDAVVAPRAPVLHGPISGRPTVGEWSAVHRRHGVGRERPAVPGSTVGERVPVGPQRIRPLGDLLPVRPAVAVRVPVAGIRPERCFTFIVEAVVVVVVVVRSEAAALPPDEHLPAILALQPGLAALTDQVAREAPRALESLRRLRQLALAAWLAHARSRAAIRGDAVTPPADEAFSWRSRLLAALAALVAFGLVDGRQVAPFKAGRARDRRVAADTLLALTDLLDQGWDRFAAKTPLVRADIDRARAVALELVEALGVIVPDDAASLRAAIWTLLARHYEEVRRALVYLRWREGDADRLVPPLASFRRSARSAPSEPAEASSTSAEPPPPPSATEPEPG